jgi:NADPH:quinone reductase-like Zn-dependent oxidoreductase
MKAIICTKYGAPEVLHLQEVAKPMLEADKVLIKIYASAVNSGDVRVRGLAVKGFLRIVMRFVLGFGKPRKPILGTVFSGIVEDVGKAVTQFQKGDKVFGSSGFKFGAHAEYIVLAENGILAPMPLNASFNDAAAIVFGGMTAVYFLNKGGVDSKPNQDILIYGATGSVGCAAIQIARWFNANVTSVCSNEGAALAKSLGSSEVIIYTMQDFAKLEKKYNIIFDAVGKTNKKNFKHLLKSEGRYLTVGGLEVAKETKSQLNLLKTIYEEGKLYSNIDRVYPIDDIVNAHKYVDTGRKKGNVVVAVN